MIKLEENPSEGMEEEVVPKVTKSKKTINKGKK
jgi:hypothetical protein